MNTNIVSSSVTSDDDILSSSSSANSYEEDCDVLNVEPEHETKELYAQVRTEIETALVSAGLSGEALLRATARTALIFERHAMEFAGLGLADVLALLGDSVFALAIRRKLTGDPTPLREAAQAIGCSAEGLRKAEARLAAELSKARAVRARSRGSEEGGAVQARKQSCGQ